MSAAMRGKLSRQIAILLAVASIVLVCSVNAYATSLRQIDFIATGLSVISGDPFAVLGLPGPVQMVTGSFIFDEDATPFFGPQNSGSGATEANRAHRPYMSFTVTIGTAALSGAPSNSQDAIYVRDGVGGAPQVADRFDVISFTDQLLDATTTLEDLRVTAGGTSNSVFSDSNAGVPSLAELNSFPTRFFEFTVGNASVSGAKARWSNLEFSETVIPLPPALLLLGSAISGLILVSWRRCKAA